MEKENPKKLKLTTKRKLKIYTCCYKQEEYKLNLKT